MNVAANVYFHVDVTDTLPVSNSVLTTYGVPCRPPDLVRTYTTGTGPNQAVKFYQVKKTAAAAVSSTDLTAVVCSDGSVGFTHVRELIPWNDDGTNTINLTTPANSFAVRFLGGTTPFVTIQPGTAFPIPPIPNAATGYLVDSTHKTVDFDPGANTIIYRLLVIGD